jgi:hypothetical protein
MTEFQIQSLIARYVGYIEHFERQTTEIQLSLRECGWQWVLKGIEGNYQEWLVSPKMFDETPLIIRDGQPYPEFDGEPDLDIWNEFVDYLLF